MGASDIGGNASFSLQQAAGSQARSQLANLQRQFANPADHDHTKLKKAAQDFEGIFVQQLLEAMDKTVDRVEGYLDGGHAEETFRGMMNQNIASNIASRPGGSGFGIAEQVYKQMSQSMSTQASNTPSDPGMPANTTNSPVNKVG